jgi:hypothetical protein
MAGALLYFAFVDVLAFGGLTKHLDRERDQAMLLGSFHFFSVRLAIGAAALVAYYVQSFPAWRLAAFLPTTIYLLVLGASPQQPTHGTTRRMVERTDLAT